MKSIGLTGNIGSGKTTVSQIFEIIGTPVYYSDIEAKNLMLNNQNLKNELLTQFGSETYLKNELNKPFLRNIVFNDPLNTEKLNKIIHPYVMNDFENWKRNQTNLFVILESAILFQTQLYKHFDIIIRVICDLESTIQRLIIRDNIDHETAIKRINSQSFNEDIIKNHKHLITITNNNESKLLSQVLQIFKNLTNNEIR